MNTDDSATSRPAWTGRIIVLGSVVVMALAAWLPVYIEKNNAGGLSEQLLATVFGEDTEYAPGYRESEFVSLKLGADESAVLQVLGEPLSRETRHGGTELRYSRSPGSNNYRVRWIELQNGRVTHKGASYYWD
jgi:hypothetical protein